MEREEKIAALLDKVLKPEGASLQDSGLDDDLTERHLSSVLVVELIVELELAFGIEIDDDDLLTENVSSIRRISELVRKYEMEPSEAGGER